MAATYGVVEETSVVDCHAHISAKEFDEDVEAVIEEAKKVGVKAVVGVTESRAEFGAMIDLHNRYPDFVAPCLGVHPVQSLCPDRSATLEDLEGVEELIREHQDNLVAIGEVGLDFTPRFIKTELDKVSQREVFSRQIKLAIELDLPLNVHSRSAGRHVIEMLLEHGAKNVILHAFDGKPSNALKGIEAGYYFSIPPSIVRSPQKEKLVKSVPLSNLLLETDSPALAAEKQTRNEPKNVCISCQAISRIKGVPVHTVCEETTKNALKLFPKLQRFIRK
ncbi:putative deoxyribonuclease TATDN3 [Acropora millepora]|uniref:putative deoxyribonuclease TATDN3 n=1 Tax=Acropora millepora TaxID=45264 RepID=UPI001CF16AB9|nr:putative deoxyribonuclease TATDN3 [Acropora millepora]